MTREWQRQLLVDFEEYIKARRTDFADEVREAEAFADEVGVQLTSAIALSKHSPALYVQLDGDGGHHYEWWHGAQEETAEEG